MTTSRRTAILSEVAAQSPSPRTQAYFQSKAVSAFYDFVINKFLEKERAGELTRAELARRTHKDRAVITRLLSRPSNITLGTLSDLLLAISGEEPIPTSAPILPKQSQPSPNQDWIWERPETGSKQAEPPKSPLKNIGKSDSPRNAESSLTRALQLPHQELANANS